MSINFILYNGSDETRNMHTKSNNIDITMGSETDETTDKLFEDLAKDLENSMRGSNFVFHSVDLSYYYLQKTSLKRIRSSHIYI